jgi:putative acetyltransferase
VLKMILQLVTSEPLVSQAREIFREYQLSLGIDLRFQDFEQELAALPGKYAPPQGRLYLAFIDEMLAGCIALRPFQEGLCEMKRLYVRPQFRGQHLGLLLATEIIAEAKKMGYRQMVLDTLDTMTAAQKLYRSLGFQEIEPYCFNPIDGALYMNLDL